MTKFGFQGCCTLPYGSKIIYAILCGLASLLFIVYGVGGCWYFQARDDHLGISNFGPVRRLRIDSVDGTEGPVDCLFWSNDDVDEFFDGKLKAARGFAITSLALVLVALLGLLPFTCCTVPSRYATAVGWMFILGALLSAFVAIGFSSDFVVDEMDATFSIGGFISIIALVYSIAIGILVMNTLHLKVDKVQDGAVHDNTAVQASASSEAESISSNLYLDNTYDTLDSDGEIADNVFSPNLERVAEGELAAQKVCEHEPIVASDTKEEDVVYEKVLSLFMEPIVEEPASHKEPAVLSEHDEPVLTSDTKAEDVVNDKALPSSSLGPIVEDLPMSRKDTDVSSDLGRVDTSDSEEDNAVNEDSIPA